jgi:hypothetical protein
MKKFFIVAGMMALATLLYNCSGSKKTTASVPPPAASNYEANVKTVIESHCSPCHIPSKGGNKKSYDNFANTKADIDDIIRRIEMNPGDRGFMPFKHPRLSDSTIAVFKKWKTDGLLEK